MNRKVIKVSKISLKSFNALRSLGYLVIIIK